MTSLRTMEGLSLNRVAALWGHAKKEQLLDDAQKYLASGDAFLAADYLILTQTGRLLADGIASDLFFLESAD